MLLRCERAVLCQHFAFLPPPKDDGSPVRHLVLLLLLQAASPLLHELPFLLRAVQRISSDPLIAADY